MRQRDATKIAKQIYELCYDLDFSVLQQLLGSAWYFERAAEGKGIDFGHASLRNLKSLTRRLQKILDREKNS